MFDYNEYTTDELMSMIRAMYDAIASRHEMKVFPLMFSDFAPPYGTSLNPGLYLVCDEKKPFVAEYDGEDFSCLHREEIVTDEIVGIVKNEIRRT